MIPSYLKDVARKVTIDDYLHLEITTKDVDEYFEIFYCGMIWKSGDNQLITAEDMKVPLKIVAKSTLTNKEIVLFDGAFYGYDNMFCDVYDQKAIDNRELIQYPLNNIVKINFLVGIGIDYESEKENYDFDEDGNVLLIDGRYISWEDTKADGFDFLEITAIDENGQSYSIMSEELA